MTCLDELTCSMYADGELAPDESRAVQEHLATCPACRRLCAALQTENSSLRAALGELAPARAPMPSGLPGGWAAVAGLLGAAGLATAWLLSEIGRLSVPPGLDWLGSAAVFAATAICWSAASLVIEEVSAMLFPTVVCLSLVGLAAAVTAHRRAAAAMGGLAAALLLTLAPPAGATEMRPQKGEQMVTIAAGETIDDTLITGSEAVFIDGTVKGDLIVMGRHVRIRGTVLGSLVCLARNVEVEGTVGGDVYGLAENLTVRGTVGRSVLSLTRQLTIDSGAHVGRDVLSGAEETRMGGEVGRDLRASGKWLELTGVVGRNARLEGERVMLPDSAKVGGDLTASAGHVDISSGATIAGARHVNDAPAGGSAHGGARARGHRSAFAQPSFYAWQLVRLAAAFVTGLVLFWIGPVWFEGQPADLRGWLSRTLVGFLGLVSTPVAAVIAGITLIGMPLALVALGAWVVGLYVAGLCVSAAIGQLIMRRLAPARASFALSLLVGLILLRVISHLPFAGCVVELLVLVVGFGMLLCQAPVAWRRLRSGLAG